MLKQKVEKVNNLNNIIMVVNDTANNIINDT